MRIPAWGPEYSVKELVLSKGRGKVKLKLEDEEYALKPDEIGIVVIGAVEAFNSNPEFADFSTVEPIMRGTIELLDALAELNVPNLYFVKCNKLENGKDLIGELKEYEEGSEVFTTDCINPAVDTKITKSLKPIKALFVTGLLGHTNILQFVNTLKAEKDSGKIGLEYLFLPDSCVGIVNKIENSDELNFWSKNYMSENSDAEIVDVYRGGTKIT